MSKNDKINFKLEVYKDKNSGKLSIKAHFDKSAPNIYKEKEDFLWAPTVEEKDFLYEAFKMIPDETPVTPSKNIIAKSDEHKETEDLSEPEKTEEIKYSSETHPPTKDSKPPDKPTEEKSSVIAASSKDIETEDTKDSKDVDKEDTKNDIDDTMLKELNDEELKTLENEQDKGLIVEADSEAIDEALKKRTKDDDSIVEADEQTIIDKVLSQKKKGRWSRK